MFSVETGQMSAVETGQMTAAETSVLSQQKTSGPEACQDRSERDSKPRPSEASTVADQNDDRGAPAFGGRDSGRQIDAVWGS